MAAQASEAASEAVSASAFESNNVNEPTVGLFTDAETVSKISVHTRCRESTPYVLGVNSHLKLVNNWCVYKE